MKGKFLFVFLFCGAFSVHAQFSVVAAPALESLVSKTHIDQVIYYVQMVEQQIQAAQNTYNQLQNMIRAEQRAIENLKGITSEQRREMWINLGMTPANYMYVQSWKAKEDAIGSIIMANREIQNEEYQAAMDRNRELSDRVMNGDMGEKGVLQAIFEVTVDTNRTTREANMQQAMALEYQLARDKQGEAPANTPVVSDWWGKAMFRPITSRNGR
jgi:hypothetical protein